MKITILAFGTRGDVQPILALAKALKSNGHSVCMVAGRNFKNWITMHGLEAADSTVDIQSVMEGPGAEDWIRRGNNPLVNMRVMRRLYLQYGRAMMMEAWEACQGSQVIISSILSDVYAVSMVEKLGARHISVWLQPSMIASRSGAATFNAPVPARDSWLNYLFTRSLVESFLWNLCGDIANQFRQEVLGLSAQTRKQNSMARRRLLVLHAYSQHIVPHPADWPSNFHTTGYWFLDEDQSWQPSRALLDFIEAGSPPICIGFGSMAGGDPAVLTRLFIEAVNCSGERAILLSGWSGAPDVGLPSNFFRLDAAPHEWLFPRVKAVVHHGGAGSTAASLRAGKPTVVVPHLADQTFWGQRVEMLGVGPKAIPREKLTVSALASAIQIAATNPEMNQRAADLGIKICAEDGIGNASAWIEQYLQSG